MRAWRPTAAAVSGITQPRASCDFQSSCRSGGRYSIANAPSDESDASTAGTRSALKRWTSVSHRTSLAFRETSARHSAATRRRPSARFTQYSDDPARTSQISDDTPPPSGSNCGTDPGGTSPARSRKSRIASTTPQKSNLSMFSFVKSSGGPRITSLPRISILPSRPASTDAAPGASLFCAISAPAYTVR